MIRPLIYCHTVEHITSSLSTIEIRLQELEQLKAAYLDKLKFITQHTEKLCETTLEK